MPIRKAERPYGGASGILIGVGGTADPARWLRDTLNVAGCPDAWRVAKGEFRGTTCPLER
jgi:hypothetical protein